MKEEVEEPQTTAQGVEEPAQQEDEEYEYEQPEYTEEEAYAPHIEGPVSAVGAAAMTVTRKRGRPPGSTKKNRQLQRQQTEEGEEGDGSQAASSILTPRKGKGPVIPAANMARTNRTVGGPNNITAVPRDTSGNPPRVENDEYVLPEDPEGEKKVTKKGALLGDRDYRVRTFTVLGRGDRLYMLSTEPARCMGFRDSYLLFQKHRRLYKVIVNDNEKFDLIERDIIPHSYKGRPIGIVTARSVFREFGARIIIGGKRVHDDYYEAEAKAVGFVPGQVADPEDRLPPDGQPYNKNQYVAWHGASAVYHQYTALPPMTTRDAIRDTAVVRKKAAPVITDDNWMYEHAKASADYNAELTKRRRLTRGGVREGHTGLPFYPALTQPTKVRWQRAETSQARSGDQSRQSGRAGQVVIDTMLSLPNPISRTGLLDVDPDVYENAVPDEIKHAIEKQKNYERQWVQT